MKYTKYTVLLLLLIVTKFQAQSTLTFSNAVGLGRHFEQNGIVWFTSINAGVGASSASIDNSFQTSFKNEYFECDHNLNIIALNIYMQDAKSEKNNDIITWTPGNNNYVEINGYDSNGSLVRSQRFYPQPNTIPPVINYEQVVLTSFNKVNKLEFDFDGEGILCVENVIYNDLGPSYMRPYPGEGSLANPFQISTLDHLKFLTEHHFEWIYNFRQTANIDASTTSTWNSGKGFLPIGDVDQGWWLEGVYDGLGYGIYNLYINRPSEDFVGFFRNLPGGSSVGNLVFNFANINGGNYTGVLAGLAPGNIIGCISYESKVNGNTYVGGLIGHSGIPSELVPSHVTGLPFYTGVKNCFSKDPIVDGIRDVGGLIGKISGSIVVESYSYGGTVTLLSNGTETNAGGLIGFADRFTEIRNCYSTSFVSIPSNTLGETGGLLGFKNPNNSAEILINNSFWDTQTSGQTNSSGGFPRTTAEMKTLSTFTSHGWDFTNTWFIIDSEYPYIRNFYNIAPPIQLTTFLEGPFNTASGNMNNGMTGNIPLSSPFTANPQTVTVIPTNVVDWVLVELRDKNNSSAIVATRSAFLLKNGSIVDLDGVTPLQFAAYRDNYYVTIKHRNHLPVMSSIPVQLN